MANENWNVRVDENGYMVVPTLATTKTPGSADRGGPIDPWGETVNQAWPLGTLLRQGDRAWRYSFNGTSGLSVGVPIQNAAAAHAEQEDDIVVDAASAVGATTVSLTSTANLDTAPNNVADDFAEGYLIVNDGAGEGHIYKILKNDLFSGTDAGEIFTLYPQESIRVALTTASEVGLIRNPYYKVIAVANVVTGAVLGVAQFAVTATRYFWLQSGGPASVIPQAAIALGTFAIVGTTAAKVNPSSAATTELFLGNPLTVGVADTEAMIVMLPFD